MANRHIEHRTEFAYLTTEEYSREAGGWVPWIVAGSISEPAGQPFMGWHTRRMASNPRGGTDHVSVYLFRRRGAIV